MAVGLVGVGEAFLSPLHISRVPISSPSCTAAWCRRAVHKGWREAGARRPPNTPLGSFPVAPVELSGQVV